MTLSETELSGRSALFLIFLSRICAFEILRRFSKRIRLCIAPLLIGSHSSIDPTLPTVSFASNLLGMSSVHRWPTC
jgi:hypothetical protein